MGGDAVSSTDAGDAAVGRQTRNCQLALYNKQRLNLKSYICVFSIPVAPHMPDRM
jgi:hypothetical protein